jgi:hypothetical protein
MLDTEFIHCFEEVDGSVDIIIVIEKGVVATFAYRLFCSEMNDQSDFFFVFFNDFFKVSFISQVCFVEFDFRGAKFFENFKGGFVGIGQIINDNQFKSRLCKNRCRMASDISQSSRNQNFFSGLHTMKRKIKI